LEDELFFYPERGNVLFVSALHCWGFSINTFSNFLKTKNILIDEKYLWGEYYENSKNR
jgi:ribosome assembly protein 1